MIVSIVQQNQHGKVYIMKEFAFKYNCKYCWTKSSWQNLRDNGVIFLWMNTTIIASIVQQNQHGKIYIMNEYEYNCKYCSANFLTKSYL